MMVDNRAGTKVTFSVPEDETVEMERILKFFKKHRINYSALIRAHLKRYYRENKTIIQELFYDNKVKSKNPT